MNSLIEQIYRTEKVEDATGQLIPCFPMAIPYETGISLYDMVREYHLCRTIELGMAYGLSTLFIRQAQAECSQRIHVAIDPYQSSMWQGIGLLNIKRAGLDDNLQFYESPSDEVLPRLCAEGEKFDMAFIDGSHLFDYALVDFFYLDKLLKMGGYIVFDDLWMPAVRRVLMFILRNRSYELVRRRMRLKVPLWRQLRHAATRIWQEPLALGGLPSLGWWNLCILRKVATDTRPWDFHRSF